jgi:hypothetical protein
MAALTVDLSQSLLNWLIGTTLTALFAIALMLCVTVLTKIVIDDAVVWYRLPRKTRRWLRYRGCTSRGRS